MTLLRLSALTATTSYTYRVTSCQMLKLDPGDTDPSIGRTTNSKSGFLQRTEMTLKRGMVKG
jgi:hypothetical protein